MKEKQIDLIRASKIRSGKSRDEPPRGTKPDPVYASTTAKKVPTRAVPAITALLGEKAALGDRSAPGGWDEGLLGVGAGGEEAGDGGEGDFAEGVGAEVGALVGAGDEGDGAFGVGAGVC
jgi:hypothetical protein